MLLKFVVLGFLLWK